MVEGVGSVSTSHLTTSYRSPDPQPAYTPHAEIVTAMNDITERWGAVSSSRDAAASGLRSRVDVELKAVTDFLSGKVPEQGSRIAELVSKMVF
jgi:hypothetical protein